MTKDKLPPYFLNYMEERFKRLEDRFNISISEIKELLKGNGGEGLIEKIEKHDKWINSFEARIGLVVSILGSLFALVFSLVKDVIDDIFKVR
jgi:hypothetical protein